MITPSSPTISVVFSPARHVKLLTTSAVGAVVVGFALQDTLGNAFAGLAIQSEKPFNIGHWITVGEHEGPADLVLELAHVARPVERHETIHRGAAHPNGAFGRVAGQ